MTTERDIGVAFDALVRDVAALHEVLVGEQPTDLDPEGRPGVISTVRRHGAILEGGEVATRHADGRTRVHTEPGVLRRLDELAANVATLRQLVERKQAEATAVPVSAPAPAPVELGANPATWIVFAYQRGGVVVQAFVVVALLALGLYGAGKVAGVKGCADVEGTVTISTGAKPLPDASRDGSGD